MVIYTLVFLDDGSLEKGRMFILELPVSWKGREGNDYDI